MKKYLLSIIASGFYLIMSIYFLGHKYWPVNLQLDKRQIDALVVGEIMMMFLLLAVIMISRHFNELKKEAEKNGWKQSFAVDALGKISPFITVGFVLYTYYLVLKVNNSNLWYILAIVISSFLVKLIQYNIPAKQKAISQAFISLIMSIFAVMVVLMFIVIAQTIFNAMGNMAVNSYFDRVLDSFSYSAAGIYMTGLFVMDIFWKTKGQKVLD